MASLNFTIQIGTTILLQHMIPLIQRNSDRTIDLVDYTTAKISLPTSIRPSNPLNSCSKL
jgi:hypothetical protein